MKRAILVLKLALAVAFIPSVARAQTYVQEWVQRYHGPGNFSDQVSAIGVNTNGDVVVTGTSSRGYGLDYATLKYSSTGVALWTNRFQGPADDNEAHAVAVDGSGNVFVTGRSAQSSSYPSNPDYATLAYSSTGLPLWTNRYNGPGNDSDVANAVAVDNNGNVLVAGESVGTGGHVDYAILAYSSAGVPLWTNRYGWPATFTSSQAIALGVDTNGNVFVTGISYSDNTFWDFATIKYSNAGVPLWTNRYTAPGMTQDQPSSLAVDRSGNVFVTGISYSTNGDNPDYVTIGYSGAGVPLWTNRYNGLGNNNDFANAIAVDGNGNVFVTGSSVGTNYAGFATIKYSGTGVPLWTNLYYGTANLGANATAVATDTRGHVFVTGGAVGESNAFEYATVAYSNDGVLVWTNHYHGPNNGIDGASAMTLDSCGSVFVTGQSHAVTGNAEFTTIKYSLSMPTPVYLGNQRLDNKIVLSWTNAAFGLQSAPASTGIFTNVPGATSPYSNPVIGAQQFFRLISN